MKTVVHKYGGSSLAHPEQIKAIAQKIAELHKSGTSIVVVVSAMGETTNELTRLAKEVSTTPNQRELDMLLTTGERISMALMSMALHDLGCPAISFTGSQAGVMTSGDHNSARIKEVKPIRVEEALKEKKVVVIAGFQGVDPNTKEVTTLGRGGSDTTAVAMAAYFKAPCYMYKDVRGVYTADPKSQKDAEIFSQISFSNLKQLCQNGSQILQLPCVELAEKLKVPLFIGSSFDGSIGTEVIQD